MILLLIYLLEQTKLEGRGRAIKHFFILQKKFGQERKSRYKRVTIWNIFKAITPTENLLVRIFTHELTK